MRPSNPPPEFNDWLRKVFSAPVPPPPPALGERIISACQLTRMEPPWDHTPEITAMLEAASAKIGRRRALEGELALCEMPTDELWDRQAVREYFGTREALETYQTERKAFCRALLGISGEEGQ